MPKLPRISAKKVLRALLRAGFYIHHQTGSHVNLRHVRQLWTLPNRQCVLELVSGERLPSGRTYGEKIRTLLTNPF